MEILFVAIPFLFMGGIFALVIVIAYFGRKQREKAWTELAARTGLTYEPGRFFLAAPTVAGSYKGYPLRLYTFSRGSGKNRTTYTRVALSVQHPEGAQLGLSHEGFFSGLGKKLGMQDVQLGDAEFDSSFVIKSQPEDYASRVLSSYDLRRKLLAAPHVNIRMGNGMLHFTRRGVDTNVDRLQATIELLADVAAAVQGESGISAPEVESRPVEDEAQWGFGGWDDDDDKDKAPQPAASQSALPSAIGGSRATSGVNTRVLVIVGVVVVFFIIDAIACAVFFYFFLSNSS